MHIGKFVFTIQPEDSLYLPDFKGATFRGTFGRALKSTICIMKQHKTCDPCMVNSRCAYPYLFETKTNSGQPALKPFVIEPPLTRKNHFTSNDTLSVGVTILGKALQYLPYFAYCFIQMGQRGIGKYRSKFRVTEIIQISPSTQINIYHPELEKIEIIKDYFSFDSFGKIDTGKVKIQFQSPTQLLQRGKPTNEPMFDILMKSIYRRYKRLFDVHNDNPNAVFPATIKPQEKEIRITHEDLWVDKYKRYSMRQRKELLLMGFTGTVTFEGNLTPFTPWLQLGELIHVGKSPVFGLGKYIADYSPAE